MAEGGHNIKNTGIDVSQQYRLSSPKMRASGLQEKPKFPEYQSIEMRMKTFKSWEKEWNSVAVLLSEAGQLQIATNGNTKCFHCGGLHRNWKLGDNPIEVHAKDYPDCVFIHQRQNNATNNSQRIESSGPANYSKAIDETNETHGTVNDTTPEGSAREDIIVASMERNSEGRKVTAAAQACLENDCSEVEVQGAISDYKGKSKME